MHILFYRNGLSKPNYNIGRDGRPDHYVHYSEDYWMLFEYQKPVYSGH